MAETKDAPPVVTSTEEKKPVAGNIVSRGPVEQVKFSPPKESTDPAAGTKAETAEEKTEREAKELALKNETPEAKTARELAEKNKPPALNEEQFAALLKERGIELDDKGIDGLKEKLKPAAATKDPAEIEKEKVRAEADFEKRMLDFYTENGGKIEDFVALKEVAAADLKALSESEIKRELKAAGFDDNEIAAVLKERYYQITAEELEQNLGESDADFEKRKARIEKSKTHFSKKLETRSSHIKESAAKALGELREAINFQDQEKEQEVKNSKRVEDFFTKLPTKVTLQLGKTEDGQELPPVEYEIPKEIIAEVQDTLKDPAKRKQFLFNEDNTLNLDNVAGIMLRNKYLEKVLKDSTISAEKRGSDRQVEIFEKTFPGRIAKDIGVGGANGKEGQGRKGVIVSAGKPERVRQ